MKSGKGNKNEAWNLLKKINSPDGEQERLLCVGELPKHFTPSWSDCDVLK